MIDISPHQLKTVKDLLALHVPDCEVRAFGSRVKWTAKNYSDLDIAIVGAGKLPAKQLADLREALTESELPFRVDVIDWHSTKENFQKIIEEQFEVIQMPRAAHASVKLSNSICKGMNVAKEWRETIIEKVADVFDGPHATPVKTVSGPVFLGITSLNKGRVDLSGSECLSEKDFIKWTRRVTPQCGDVVFSYETKLGEAAIIPKGLRCCLGRRMGLMRPKPNELDGRFLLYYYLSPKFQEIIRERTIHGSTVDRIALVEFPKFPIKLPPLNEQKAIARILGTLDDKIELNRRMNATLEAMARTLFKSWFVDFDPVHAKAAGRIPSGMDTATAALFPDSFQASELGKIPNGWTVGTLDKLIDFVIGGDWGANEETHDTNVPCYCIRGADIPDLQASGLGKMPVRFLKPSSVQKRQLFSGDIVIEISGGSPTQCTGRPVLISDGLLRSLDKPLVASNFCRIMKLKYPAYSKFIYCLIRELYDAGSLFQFETGSTGIKNFGFVRFAEAHQLSIPEPGIVEAFDKAISVLFSHIQANASQSRVFANIRDTLLPKLLSGELDVVDVKMSSKHYE
jgi:Restriction endonuclease S subunits